ncbi:DegT/DnrJ/EryC1/StrS family aminotransferase [Schleiferiaceae bacterium]|nr:DegT/DnrJ/EryC1/StrS family aminotransferase [Schleiferiaceae bacterium]
MQNIPFSPPFIDERVISEVNEVLNSGWITTGPKCIQLEDKVSSYLGVNATVSCNSWSSGAQIVLRLLGIGEGDEVIIPNYTYAATLLAVYHVGAKPIIVDVDENYQLNISNVVEAITPKTKAVMPVDIGGLPTDIESLRIVLQKKSDEFYSTNEYHNLIGRIAIINDAAHSFGATIGSVKVGRQADFTIFSLHAVKNLTSAEGGIITFNLPQIDSEALVKELKLIRLNGQTKDALAKTQNLANWEYDIVLKGYKMNMPDICAAIALGQLESYDLINSERKRVYDRYASNFKVCQHLSIIPSQVENRISSHHLMMISLNEKMKSFRNQIISACANKGVSTNVHFKPLTLMSAFQKEEVRGSLAHSIDLFEREISLPIYPQLSNEQVDYISKTIMDAINEVAY